VDRGALRGGECQFQEMAVEAHADQLDLAGLLRTEQIARTPQVEIPLAEGEARAQAAGGLERPHALLGGRGQLALRIAEQKGHAASAAAADAAAQLMQLS